MARPSALACALKASTSPPNAANVVVVNTCSVTAEADRAARAFIRRTHRLNPQARIVVTGCYAQRAPEELSAIPGVSAVVGNSHKALAPEIILDLTRHAFPNRNHRANQSRHFAIAPCNRRSHLGRRPLRPLFH